uniref:Uncharacterized protein n=1 Tax=Rhizophora mucronata TaxID=61149 RepID=A0A2P2JKE4_RHIMU
MVYFLLISCRFFDNYLD